METPPPGSEPSLLSPMLHVPLRAALPGVDLQGAEPLGGGWEVAAFRAGEWVIRLPRSRELGAVIERQTGLYLALSAAGFPVPRDARVVHGAGGAVVAGLYRHVAGDPEWPRRRAAGLEEEIGRFLTALHAFPAPLARPFCRVVDDFWVEWTAPQVERCRPHLSSHARAWLDAMIEPFLAGGGGRSAPVVLIHGDLAEHHVLVAEDGRLRAVIDFKGPLMTDPAVDFGVLAERFGWDFAGRVLASYGGAVDAALLSRARFYSRVGSISAIDSGLRHGNAERVRRGLKHLAAQARESSESG